MRGISAAVVVLVAASAGLAGIQYDVISVGATGSGLNNDGVVVGTHSRDAFWWTQATGRRTIGPTTYDQTGVDVNDAGIMIGHTKTTFNYGRYSRYGTFAYNVWTGEDVGSDVSRVHKTAAINNANLTCGINWKYDAPNGSHYQGYSYHRDALSQPFAVAWGEGYSPQDMNDHDIAVASNGRVRTAGVWIDIDRGTSSSIAAYGINDKWTGGNSGGAICGAADNMPCYWDGYGNLHVLGGDGVTSGRLLRVNDHGQMVGYVNLDGIGQRAALYQNGVLTVLNDVITTATTLTDARDINDRGQILVQASGGAVLLNPVYFPDGRFNANSLTETWAKSGPGSAQVIDDGQGDYFVELTAGSPVTITQNISTPGAAFDLSFDYQFLTTDPAATLTVTLNGVEIDLLGAPDTLAGEFTTRTITISHPADGLFSLTDAPLAFTYDGPTGTQILLDNVLIVQAIPEPATAALLAMGALLTARRKRG